MRVVATLALLLQLAACASRGAQADGSGWEPLRVCVRNETVGYGDLIAHAGLARFDVSPGREVCKRVSETGSSLRLTATTTSGGSQGPLTFALNLQTGHARCWRWTLSNTRASAGNAVPCELGEMPP